MTSEDLSTGVDYGAELITWRPGWFVVNGLYVILAMFLAGVTIAAVIPFSSRIRTTARLTAINYPKPLVAKQSARIATLNFKDGSVICRGEIVAVLEGAGSLDSILSLEVYLRKCLLALTQHDIPRVLERHQRFDQLGELQSDYQNFIKAESALLECEDQHFDPQKRTLLMSDLDKLKKQQQELETQRALKIEDGKLSQEDFEASKTLKEEHVLSAQEYRNERSKLISRKLPVSQVELEIISNSILQNEKLKEIQVLKEKSFEAERDFQAQAALLLASIERWKSLYVFLAPVDGTLSFTRYLEAGNQITEGDKIAFVTPRMGDCYAELTIPQPNFGKISIGQKVLIRLPSYPYAEYGALEGSIQHISTIPTDSGYLARVGLPQGLLTTFKKRIPYKEGLLGDANIIIEDQTLLKAMFTSSRR